jgi:hypothetical protein
MALDSGQIKQIDAFLWSDFGAKPTHRSETQEHFFGQLPAWGLFRVSYKINLLEYNHLGDYVTSTKNTI